MKRRFLTFLLALGALLALAPALYAQSEFTLGPPMKNLPGGSYVFFNTAEKKSYWIFVFPNYLEVTAADNYLNGGAVPRRVQLAFPRSLGQVKVFIEKFFTYAGKNYILYSAVDESKNQTIYGQELSQDFALQGAPMPMAKFTDSERDTRVMQIADSYVSIADPVVGISKSGGLLVFVKKRWLENKLEIKSFSMERGDLGSQVISMEDYRYMEDGITVTEGGHVYIAGV